MSSMRPRSIWLIFVRLTEYNTVPSTVHLIKNIKKLKKKTTLGSNCGMLANSYTLRKHLMNQGFYFYNLSIFEMYVKI